MSRVENYYMDMRQVEKGSVLDEFHFSSWASFLRFAIERDDFRKEFEHESGMRFVAPSGAPLEAAIDEACGVDVERRRYVHHFARWVTPKYFGTEEDLSPSIQQILKRPEPA